MTQARRDRPSVGEDRETLASIRAMMAEAERPAPAPEKRAVPKPPLNKTAAPPSSLPAHDQPVEAPPKADPAPKPSLRNRLKKRHIVLALIALFVVLRPVLVIGLLILAAMILTGVFLMVGYDTFWRRFLRAVQWYGRRRPDRLPIIQARLDRAAERWDRFLDRFPEGTVDQLYLPDFGDLAGADDRHSAAMDRRLDALRDRP